MRDHLLVDGNIVDREGDKLWTSAIEKSGQGQMTLPITWTRSTNTNRMQNDHFGILTFQWELWSKVKVTGTQKALPQNALKH